MIGWIGAVFAALLLAAPRAAGADEDRPPAALQWGGYLLGDLRVGAGEDFAFADPALSRDELRLDLTVEARPTERLRLFAETWASATGVLSGVDPVSLAELTEPERNRPLTLHLREAYADLYGFPLPWVDLRAGRQRLAWGSAERVSVLDVLDRDDLEDRWDFGRHLASDALRLTAYFGEHSLQAVYAPVFRPALLPAGGAFLPDLAGVAALDPAPTVSFLVPGDDPGANATAGLRLQLHLLGWDVALSYAFAREDVPVVTRLVLAGPSDLQVDLSYPRFHLTGLDVAGELFGLGVWAELAAFWPQSGNVVDLDEVDVSALAAGEPAGQKARPYLKAVAGLDYTFAGGLYANLQYAYGMPFETVAGSQEHYLLLGVEWRLLHDRLKLGPLGLALEAEDPADFAGTWGVLLNPELSLYPADNVELTAGARWLAGQEGTRFGQEEGEVYLRGRFSF